MNHDGLYKERDTPIRESVRLPLTSWPVSQAARMTMQEAGMSGWSMVHAGDWLAIEAWFEPTPANKERWERARRLLLLACLWVSTDKKASEKPLVCARAVVDRCFALFHDQETF